MLPPCVVRWKVQQMKDRTRCLTRSTLWRFGNPSNTTPHSSPHICWGKWDWSFCWLTQNTGGLRTVSYNLTCLFQFGKFWLNIYTRTYWKVSSWSRENFSLQSQSRVGEMHLSSSGSNCRQTSQSGSSKLCLFIRRIHSLHSWKYETRLYFLQLIVSCRY